MAVSIPTWADLGPVKIVDGLGSPTRVRISAGLRRLPTPPLERLTVSPKKGFFRGEGYLFLCKEPLLGGSRWWLVASWFLGRDTEDPNDHEAIFRETEPIDTEVIPLAPVCISSRWAVSAIQFVDFTVRKDHMLKLASLMGKPTGEGEQFFNRLLPGRLPSAVRATSNHWAIWLQL